MRRRSPTAASARQADEGLHGNSDGTMQLLRVLCAALSFSHGMACHAFAVPHPLPVLGAHSNVFLRAPASTRSSEVKAHCKAHAGLYSMLCPQPCILTRTLLPFCLLRPLVTLAACPQHATPPLLARYGTGMPCLPQHHPRPADGSADPLVAANNLPFCSLRAVVHHSSIAPGLHFNSFEDAWQLRASFTR